MLQNTGAYVQAHYENPEQGLDLRYYLQILRRRLLYLVAPFGLVLTIGFAIVMLLRPVYVSEGKILVESQQIPIDLVRPTVTAAAKERIQVIEQRVMTRENLLAIVNKFRLFADRQQPKSGTELLDLMREHTHMQPIELDQPRRRNDDRTIALSVSFEHERPEVAVRVANELMTLILAEDARNRTNRAMETTRFLAREVKKLEVDLASIDGQISEHRRRNSDPVPERVMLQLATLKAELQEKSAVYSSAHPELIRLKRQVAALEQVTAQRAQIDSGLDALQNQRSSIQRSLDKAAEKLTAARLGESLERDQFSERLEVLEQAVLPQKPIKPNRPKMLAIVLALAVMAGIGGIFAVEMLDNTIRSSRDLASLAHGHMVVAIPYISTSAEMRQEKRRILRAAGLLVATLMVALAAAHVLLRPLDELWTIFLARLLP